MYRRCFQSKAVWNHKGGTRGGEIKSREICALAFFFLFLLCLSALLLSGKKEMELEKENEAARTESGEERRKQ